MQHPALLPLLLRVSHLLILVFPLCGPVSLYPSLPMPLRRMVLGTVETVLKGLLSARYCALVLWMNQSSVVGIAQGQSKARAPKEASTRLMEV